MEINEKVKVLTWPFLEETLACPYTDDAFFFSQVGIYDTKENCMKGKISEHFSSNSSMVILLPKELDKVKDLLSTYSIHAKKHFK